jgi:hypothetical protein
LILFLVEKQPDDPNSTKIKIKRDDIEEKVEEEPEETVQIISADEFKIHIEKEGSDGMKIKNKPDGEE